MGTGSLALWLLVNAVGAGDAPIPMKDRTISIPYNLSVNPADVSDVVLYVSIDQGRAWSRAAVIRPTDRFFAFQAPTDGQYWFTVAVVYRNGSQVPADPSQSPPQQKVIFDTQKPAPRFTAADRAGEEVVVTWDIQEANPDLATMKLEYRPTEATAGGFWYAVPASPGLAGQARFRPNTPGPVTVKLSMTDTAGNLGWVEKALPPAGASLSGYSGVAPVPPVTQASAVGIAPQGVAPVAPPPTPYDQLPAPAPINPAPVAPVDSQTQAPVALAVSNRTADAARTTPAVMTSAAMNRPDLPPVFHCNEPQVTVEYEIERQGPSGVSRVDVYVSQDEGRTWMDWQHLTRNDFAQAVPAPAATLPVTLRLPDRDGQFWYRLVPISGADLSTGPPRAGDLPDVRIQVDRSAPVIELFSPQPDARDANALTLSWKATDPNLATSPVRIFWSESPAGEWKSVTPAGPTGLDGASLPATGKYTWSLPPGMPLKVYLKAVAVDQAGNSGEAVTPQPILIDLLKPSGKVRGLVGRVRG
jgi:hypothetical protein